MSGLSLLFLGLSVVIGFAVFRMGLAADWRWGGALFAALIPVGFTFFLGVFGLIIGMLFAGAVWKMVSQ